MSQNVQGLINKIKQEGLEASQQKAQEIEQEARKKADGMMEKARVDAEKVVADARARQEQMEQSTRASLQQASRDTILSLKQEVNALLMRIVQQDVRDALGKDKMTALIVELAKDFVAQDQGAKTVEIGLNEETRKLIGQDVLAKLQKEIKKGVSVQAADDLSGGFTISFDEGKSCFDFSEDALVTYLSRNMNEYVKDLLIN